MVFELKNISERVQGYDQYLAQVGSIFAYPVTNITIADPTMTNKVDLPDLIPYQLEGWDDAIVISTEAETNTDAEEITTEDTLYIDWAALNQGSVNTVNTIHFRLSLDGSPIKNWSINQPLKPNSAGYVQDFKIDPLPAGNHTLTLEVDYRNEEPESNEENNIFEKEFTVVNVVNMPDLVAYQLEGWDGLIVISTEEGTNTDAVEITTEDSLYIDWAALNQGSVNTVNTFHTRLLLDGSPIKNWSINPPLKPNYYRGVLDFELDPLPAGNHTLTLEVDYLNQEPESNEENNVFEKEFTVVPVDLPDLIPYQLEGWDGAIVISTEAETNTDAVEITTEDSLYIDWAALNQGSVNTVNTIDFRLSLDGSPIKNWYSNSPLKPNSYGYVQDFKIDPLPAGNHTLTLEVDYLNQEPESNEENNVFEKEFTVVPAGTEFNINQFGDSTNPGSLRHAIIQANNSAENDVINLAEGTYTLSLAGQDENKARKGDLDIADNGTLTIQGLGNGAVIDAQEIDRVFDIAEGATLILSNVTVTNGNALSNSHDDSSPIDEQPVGGGILVRENSNLTLMDSTISHNKTTQVDSPDLSGGGGIFADTGANVTITNSTIINNEVTKKYNGKGGGIYIRANATASITNSLITLNKSEDGAGIANRGNTTLDNTEVSLNSSDGSGAGIYNYRSDQQDSPVILELNDSFITNNTAGANGAGIYNKRAEATLNNTKVTDNFADGNGGGIYYDASKDMPGELLIVNRSEINHNTAYKDYGGGICSASASGIMEISDSFIKVNKVVGDFEQGGGIYNEGSATLNRVTIAENTAYDGGGIYQLGELNLVDSVVEKNIAEEEGGGLNLGGKTTIQNSIIRNNQTIGLKFPRISGGGGINVNSSSVEPTDTTIIDTRIEWNQSVTRGGGIKNERGLTLINTKVINNHAPEGGGIYYNRGRLNLIDSNIDSNQATNGNGGGIFHNGGLLEVVNSSITNNIATSGSGGGIHHTKGTLSRDPLLHLIGSTVAANQSDGHGAGIYFPITTSVHKIINSTIIRNIVDADGDGNGTGGGIAITKPTVSDWLNVILENTVIAYNQTGLGEENDVYGGVFNYYDYEGNNNNLIGNTDGAYGVTGMDGPFGENDLLNIDPLLGPLQDNGNGRLTAAPRPGSPLIDAGNNDNLPADTYDVDGDGNMTESLPFDGRGDDRIKGERVDIGAVEGTDTAALFGNLDLDGDGQGSLAHGCLNIEDLGTSDLISNLMKQLVVNLIAYGLNENGITGAELSEFLDNYII